MLRQRSSHAAVFFQYLHHILYRLIVVAEKQDVYKKFPIPLINRLEKHFLATTNMLTTVQIDIARELDQWAKDFATLHAAQQKQKQRLSHLL